MTKHLVLALALTLGTAAAAPPAFACGGGYARFSPEERAVRVAITEQLRDRFADGETFWVTAVEIEGERATARLTVSGEPRNESHEVTLRLRRGEWRVTGVRRAQA